MKEEKASVGVVVPAAGKGIRLGGGRPKQLLELAGKPLIVHTLERFERSPRIDAVVLVTSSDLIRELETLVGTYRLSKVVAVVVGGKERQDSVGKGLEWLSAEPPEYVLIHDAVRPFPDDTMIERVLDAAARYGAAVPALPPKETIKIGTADRFVGSTPPRDELWSIQTPQGFRFLLLLEAYRKASEERFYGTDDASLVERLGNTVKIVDGNYENIKITTTEDLELAQVLYNRRMSG